MIRSLRTGAMIGAGADDGRLELDAIPPLPTAPRPDAPALRARRVAGRRSARLAVALALLSTACPRAPTIDDKPKSARSREASRPPKDPEVELAHQIVFADRIAHSYVLLLDPTTPAEFTAPTREALQEMVREALRGHEDDEEVRLLLELIARDPQGAAVDRPGAADLEADDALPAPDTPDSHANPDLIGLAINLDTRAPGGEDDPLIPTRFLEDPISTRDLDPQARASLAGRRHRLVLRALYRNAHAVRGLRLLQTLVRVVAARYDALIFDPDTGETVTLETFARRRLQTKLGNVADQIVVVPFADTRNGAGYVRLSTRGMRRFGSVDLELDGLPRDPESLQRATFLLEGLAYKMILEGVLDPSGFAIRLGEIVTIHRADCAQAYAGRGEQLPRCDDCPESVDVHLVERPAEAHDPVDHVVARVVAPRSVSDAPGYEQPTWAAHALERMFGPLP